MTLNNPILKRELKSTLRSPKTIFLIWAYMLLVAGVLLLLWPGSGIHSLISEKSKQLFSLFFSIDLTLLILLIPAFSATSITSEKEGSTFPALFTTLLSPLDIMFGKLAASAFMLILLTFLSMPIASICALTGGVSMAFIVKIMFLILMTAISYGFIGLLCSAICESSTSAILLNYVIIMILAGATWLPDALLSSFGFNVVWQIIRSFSPFDAIFYLLYPDTYEMSMSLQAANVPLSPYSVYIIFSFLIAFISVLFFYIFIMRPEGRGSKRAARDSARKVKRKLGWPFYLLDPLKRKKPIRRFSNPVFIAEVRSKLFANPKFVIRGVSAIFIISMGLLTLIACQFGVTLRADTVRTVSIIFQIGVVAMLAPGVSSGLITDEIHRGTFMPLRMTLLSPLTLITGKLKATFFYALIFIISSLFVLFAMAYLEQQNIFPEGSMIDPGWWTELFKKISEASWWADFWQIYGRIFVWIGILLLSTITFLTAGLFTSSFSKSTGASTAAAYTITAIICIVSFAPVVLGEKLSPVLSGAILSINPIVAAMQITSDAFGEYPGLWAHNLIMLVALTLFFLFGATLRTWYLFNKQE